MKFIAPFLKDVRLLFIVIAIFLYGAFSSPTPDNPGFIEFFIFLLFLFAVGTANSFKFIFDFSFYQKQEKWKLSLILLFLYGLMVSVFIGLYQGASLLTMARDIAGFIFLCLPLFLLPFLLKSKEHQDVFIFSLLFIGLCFSIRVLFLDFSFFSQREELLYLANSPLVLFCALYAVLKLFDELKHFLKPQKYLLLLGWLGIAVLPMAAMYIDFQRASFLAIMVSLLIMLMAGFVKKPLQMALPFILLLVLGSIFYDQVLGVIENIVVKTSKVGLNMRYQELIAVYEHMAMNQFNLFFGYGWGAQFASPAVGGVNVAYTHSLLTYMLLKTGVVGLGLTLIYLFFMFEKLAQLVFIRPVKGIALMWPFVIPIFLYAAYKSIDYGFILTVILVMNAQLYRAKLH